MSGGWVEGKFSYIIVGEEIVLSHEWVGATSVTLPGSTVYYNRGDVTSTVMPSGSDSVSGIIQTAPNLVANALHANGKYVVEFNATVDGNKEIRKLQLDVIEHGKEY